MSLREVTEQEETHWRVSSCLAPTSPMNISPLRNSDGCSVGWPSLIASKSEKICSPGKETGYATRFYRHGHD